MADNNITLPIDTEVDIGKVQADGKRIGETLTQNIDRASKDAGKGFTSNIEKARKQYERFSKDYAKLRDTGDLVPSKQFVSLAKEVETARAQLQALATTAYEAEKARDKAVHQHKKRPFTADEVTTYIQNAEAQLKTVNKLEEQLYNLPFEDRFKFGDQSAKVQGILRNMNSALANTDDFIQKATQSEQEFVQAQTKATQKANEEAKAKADAQAKKEADKTAAEEARKAEAYARTTTEIQRYVDAARSQEATLNDVANAISHVVGRMAELESVNGPLPLDQFTEYNRLSGQLDELTLKYQQLKREASARKLFQDLSTAASEAAESVKRLVKQIAKLAGSALKTALGGVTKSIKGMGHDSRDTSRELQHLIRNIIKYGFGVRSVYFLYRRLRSALTEALKEMGEFDTTGLGASLNQLSSSLLYLRNAWAAAFSPIIQYVTPILVQLMDLLADVGNAIAALFATLTGKGTVVKAIKQQKALAGALDGTGSSAGGAADALGKLADFDELNIIGNDSGGGGGGGGGGGSGDNAGGFIVETIENELSDLINANKWFEIGQLFADKLNTLTEAADKWINDVFRPWGVKWATNLGNFLNGFIYHYDWELLGKTFADGLNAILDIANTWYTTVNWEWFGSRLGDGVISAINNIDWELVGTTFANKLNKSFDLLYGFVTSFFAGNRARDIGDAIATGFNSFFETIHWDNAFNFISNGFNGIFESLKGFIKRFNWDSVGDTISTAFNTAIQNIDAESAGRAINTFVFNVLDQLNKINLFAVGEKIGAFLANIDWGRIFLTLAGDILKILSGVLSGAFNGEYGDDLAAMIAGAFALKLVAAFAKIKVGEMIAASILKSVGVGAAATAGAEAAAGAAGGAGGLAGALGGISAGPIIAVVGALAGVALMMSQAVDWLNQYNRDLHTLDETTQEHMNNLDLLIQQTEGYHDASVRQMGVYETENDRIRTLADSYLALFDENGKVKKGMEERASYYYSQLASALGLEEEQLQTLVGKNGDLRGAIEEVITAKTQDRAVSAYLDEYQFALENTKTAQDAVTAAEADLERALHNRNETAQAVDKAQQDYIDHLGQGVEVEAQYKKKLDDAIAAHSKAEYAVQQTSKEIDRANDELIKINATADFYEGYIAAIATNDTELINAALKRMQDGFITAEEGDKASLNRQANNMREYYSLLLSEMEKGNPNVTQEMLDEAKGWVDTADKELAKLNKTGADAMEDLKSGMSTKKQLLITEAQRTSESIANAYKNSLRGVLNGVDMGTPTANLPTYSYQSTSGNITPKRNGYARLAKGAVLPPNDPFLAIVGDQKRGTNVEAPLATIEEAVRNVVGDSNYSPEVVQLLQRLITVVESKNLTISRREVGDAAISEINSRTRRTGNTPILG